MSSCSDDSLSLVDHASSSKCENKDNEETAVNEKPVTRCAWWIDYANIGDDNNEGLKWHTTEFPMESNNQFEWKLSLYSPGLSLYLENVRTNEQTTINVETSFSITNDTDDRLYTKIILVSGKVVKSQSYGFTEFIKIEELLDFLIEGRFKISCEMRDVDGDHVLGVNKLVLAANSPVFERMFSHDMKESLTKEVEIKGIDQKVLQEMLRFMYSKKVNFRNLADRLLIAANRYEMEALKLICEQELISTMTLMNVIDFLMLADKHNALNLKRKCLYVIIRNFKAVVETTDYEQLSMQCPHIIVELSREMAAKCSILVTD